MSQVRRMAFTSPNWLLLPLPSVASAAHHHVGLHSSFPPPTSFPHQWTGHISSPFLWVNYIAEPLQHITFFSGGILKSLPLSQSINTSKVPRQEGFPILACCGNSAAHLLHLLHVSCIMYGNNPPFEHPAQHRQSESQKELNFSTNYFQSCSDPFICCQHPFLIWSIVGLTSSVSLTPKPQASASSWSLGIPWSLLLERILEIHPSCSLGHCNIESATIQSSIKVPGCSKGASAQMQWQAYLWKAYKILR